MIWRWLLVLGALLFANSANCGGAYQYTKDGRTLIWNNFPRRGDAAAWSGGRDAAGYATGRGTLTWYKSEQTIVTGSNIPAPARGSVARSRYSGNMVRGKFQGMVVNIEANGRAFHGTFANGAKTSDWAEGPMPSTNPPFVQSASSSAGKREPAPPAVGPPLDERRTGNSSTAVVTKSASGESLQAVTPPSSLRAPVVAAIVPPAQPSVTPIAVEPLVRNRIIADFKQETQSVFARVSDATGNFHEIDRLDSVQELPTPVSEIVDALMDRARDFRAKLGYETALHECRLETQTADALSVVDQVTHTLATGNAAEAVTSVSEFLKNNPEPPGEGQKNLWDYLASVRSSCSRSEKEAAVHLQQAQLFVSAGKISDAIREYQEAFRIFPTPATAEKIRKLQQNSLGL